MTAIPDLERRVFAALRTTEWLPVQDVAAWAEVTIDTAKVLCEHFWARHYLVRIGAAPNFKYHAMHPTWVTSVRPVYRAHFAALMTATEPARQEHLAEGGSDVTDVS